MLKSTLLAFVIVIAAVAPARAVTTIVVGNHVVARNSGSYTLPIFAISDAGETLQGIDLYLVMAPLGPIITNVDLINGTVFEPNNVGQFDYAMPEHIVPTRQPAYYTTTASNSVPVGVVALVTIDTTNANPGFFTLSLNSEIFGPSAVYNQIGEPGTYWDGSVTMLVPEPASVLLSVFALAGFAAFGIRHRARAK